MLDRRDVALDWCSSVYLPTVEVIHDERLDEICPQVTDSDRFLWVYERRRDLSVEHGALNLDDAARRATREVARRRRGVPRLLRRSL